MAHVFEEYTSPENFKKLVAVENVPLFLDKINNEYANNIAVKTSETDITYNKLYKDVKSVCNVLKNNNIEKGNNVAVYSPNNYNFVKCALATMSYGSVATLLPFQLDEKSVYGCCMKYDITLFFYDASLEEKVEFAKKLLPNVKFVKIEEFEENNEIEFCYDIKQDDPACIVLTGGTTGKSKGAILSHRALMKGTLNGTYGSDYIFNQVYYSIMPLTHVFGLIRNLMTSLYSGSMIFFNEDKKNMFKEMQMVKPTVLIVVPALAELFLNLVKQFGLGMLGGNVKLMICGGASVSPYLVTEFRKLGICFCPGYGLTELANLVSGNANPDKPSSVGLLYPDQEIKLVNDELWIKGENLMSGYYNEPEENKNAFEDGWFKTGDLVRFDDEGYMYITGRVKDIIVLSNGENVSPAYIEDKINELPFIQDSQVYECPNTYGVETLTAEVILRKAEMDKLQVSNLQQFVESEINKINLGLMEYERISNVIIRDTDFPRSPSMKIIRNKRVVNND